MAESKRRGEEPEDDDLDDLDESFDDAVDDDADDDEDQPVSRGGTATRERRKAEPAVQRALAGKMTIYSVGTAVDGVLAAMDRTRAS